MIKVTSEPGGKAGPGLVEGVPVYCLGGVRHEGGVSPVQALVWNVRTCRFDVSTQLFWLVGDGRTSSRGNGEGESTGAKHRGGLSRSSGEAW